jgi:hypothetical protein
MSRALLIKSGTAKNLLPSSVGYNWLNYYAKINLTVCRLFATSKPAGPGEEQVASADPGWAASLSMKVMDNLQFFIEKVHIRFEDVRSIVGQPFALGLTLDHLHIESANENWEPSFNSVGQSVKHKVVKWLALLNSSVDYTQECRCLLQYEQG